MKCIKCKAEIEKHHSGLCKNCFADEWDKLIEKSPMVSPRMAEKTGEATRQLMIEDEKKRVGKVLEEELKTINKIDMTKEECDELAKDKDKLQKAILDAEKPKGLKRWKFSTNVIPCMKESDDGTYWSCSDVKSFIRKRWEKLNQVYDEWDINDEYGAAMRGSIEELEEIYLELTGEVLK